MFVYVDESGWQSPEWCVLAGFIGAPTDWDSLRVKWRATLEEFGVPDFHSKVFFQRHNKRLSKDNPYRGWNDEKGRTFLGQLLDVIHETNVLPIGAAVNVRHFKALNYDDRRFISGGTLGVWTEAGKPVRQRWMSSGAPTKPYFAVFANLIGEALEHTPNQATVHFVFDQQNVLKSGVNKQFSELIAGQFYPPIASDKLGEVGFAVASREPALQPADIHAYSWYAYLTRGENPDDERHWAWWAISRKRPSLQILNSETMAEELARWRADMQKQIDEAADADARLSAY